MKGVGEPHFEHDFPPGSDIVGDILNGPKASERMEMEFQLFDRLAHQVDLYPEKEEAGVDADEDKDENKHITS